MQSLIVGVNRKATSRRSEFDDVRIDSRRGEFGQSTSYRAEAVCSNDVRHSHLCDGSLSEHIGDFLILFDNGA